MKFLVVSDIHYEMKRQEFVFPKTGYDAVILAGDISTGILGCMWASREFPNHPVIYVPGNHEYYGYQYWDVEDGCSEISKDTNLIFLNNGVHEFEDTTVIGSAMWTDFALQGDRQENMDEAKRYMNDYRLIKETENTLLSPEATLTIHKGSREFVDIALATLTKKKRVVVTHHLPSMQSIGPAYKNNSLNSAFASNLDHIIKQHQPELWVHGHTHTSMDYKIGQTRVLCNPAGYPLANGTRENKAFNPNLIVEV